MQKKRRLVLDDDEEEETDKRIAYKKSAIEDRVREAIAREIFEDDESDYDNAVDRRVPSKPNFGVSVGEDEEEEDEDGQLSFFS